jgi:hypothetical protein
VKILLWAGALMQPLESLREIMSDLCRHRSEHGQYQPGNFRADLNTVLEA